MLIWVALTLRCFVTIFAYLDSSNGVSGKQAINACCQSFFPKVFFGYENLSSSYLTAVFGMIFPPFVIGLNRLFNEFKTVQELYNKLID